MSLAGVNVRDDLVLRLALLVDDWELEAKLRGAFNGGVDALVLETDERETILRALEEPPEGLAELRSVLVQEHERRRAGGH